MLTGYGVADWELEELKVLSFVAGSASAFTFLLCGEIAFVILVD